MIGLSMIFWFAGCVLLLLTQQWLGLGLGMIIMAAAFRLVEAIDK